MKISITQVLQCALAAAVMLLVPSLSAQPPASTDPMGQKFGEPKPAKTIRVLLAGAGSSHDFPKYFLTADAETLKAAGGIDVAATPNLDETLRLLPQADVLVFSGNHAQYAKPEFQKALNDFADAGKGIVILHAATWYNWPANTGYNKRFVGGGTKGHGSGDFEVTVKNTSHPVTKDVAPKFIINDESYRQIMDVDANVEILAENPTDHTNAAVHPSVWVVKDPRTRIVAITLGHAEKAHASPHYQKLLLNSIKWTASR